MSSCISSCITSKICQQNKMIQSELQKINDKLSSLNCDIDGMDICSTLSFIVNNLSSCTCEKEILEKSLIVVNGFFSSTGNELLIPFSSYTLPDDLLVNDNSGMLYNCSGNPIDITSFEVDSNDNLLLTATVPFSIGPIAVIKQNPKPCCTQCRILSITGSSNSSIVLNQEVQMNGNSLVIPNNAYFPSVPLQNGNYLNARLFYCVGDNPNPTSILVTSMSVNEGEITLSLQSDPEDLIFPPCTILKIGDNCRLCSLPPESIIGNRFISFNDGNANVFEANVTTNATISTDQNNPDTFYFYFCLEEQGSNKWVGTIYLNNTGDNPFYVFSNFQNEDEQLLTIVIPPCTLIYKERLDEPCCSEDKAQVIANSSGMTNNIELIYISPYSTDISNLTFSSLVSQKVTSHFTLYLPQSEYTGEYTINGNNVLITINDITDLIIPPCSPFVLLPEVEECPICSGQNIANATGAASKVEKTVQGNELIYNEDEHYFTSSFTSFASNIATIFLCINDTPTRIGSISFTRVNGILTLTFPNNDRDGIIVPPCTPIILPHFVPN